MKGALYLLNSRTYMHTCLRDWRFVPSFIIHICQAQHEDKVSLQIFLIAAVRNDVAINHHYLFTRFDTEGILRLFDKLWKYRIQSRGNGRVGQCNKQPARNIISDNTRALFQQD
jgi:hypothetical protein